ncbi:MAG: PD40 domain-containing protein, partial [Bacteroidetes bacterium]|nr:PD40 domain-containing protein [Bacteroidota bacterium]
MNSKFFCGRFAVYHRWILLSPVLFFHLFFNASPAQNIEFKKSNFKDRPEEFKKADGDLTKGRTLYQQLNYEEALEYLIKANDFNPDNADLNYMIGDAYLNTPSKAKSIIYFEKALRLDTAVRADIRFLCATAWQLNLQFDKAIKEYSKYRKKFTPGSKELPAVDKRIYECNSGKELLKDTLHVKIENLGTVVNSAYTDYASAISADESVLFFTSRRKGSTGNIFHPFLGEYMEDIYISYYKDSAWTEPGNLGEPVNSNRHDAIAGLSFDGQRLYVYRDNIKGRGDIFQSILEGDRWTMPMMLPEPINFEESHESSACLDYDNKTLYFVSDRETTGALGGRDIYYCEWDAKKKMWGPVKNLGKEINTPYDEETPFIHPDGKTLYFSSKGHNSMGGYDIFKTTKKGRSWNKPKNIGHPINTPDDDIFFVVSASGKHAYYSSAKIGGSGKRDLYRISFIQPPSEPYQPELTLVKGFICDEETKLPIGAKIEITDNQKNEMIFATDANSSTGKYLVSLPSGKNYGIAVTAEGYLFHSENFDIPVAWKYQEIEKNICLKKIKVGEKIVLKNIFYDFDMATLRPESAAEL